MPAVFKDPLVVRSSHWVLSTSAISAKHFPVYGWGEVRLFLRLSFLAFFKSVCVCAAGCPRWLRSGVYDEL
jgi:hypothetical protein